MPVCVRNRLECLLEWGRDSQARTDDLCNVTAFGETLRVSVYTGVAEDADF